MVAIKTLIDNTNVYCVNQNVENTFQGYLVDGEKTVYFYDVPHPLKEIKNSLLKYNLKFRQNSIKKEAPCDHLVELYRLDQQLGKFSQFKN